MLLGNRKLSVDGALINAGLLNSIKRYPENGVRNLDRTKFILGRASAKRLDGRVSAEITPLPAATPAQLGNVVSGSVGYGMGRGKVEELRQRVREDEEKEADIKIHYT